MKIWSSLSAYCKSQIKMSAKNLKESEGETRRQLLAYHFMDHNNLCAISIFQAYQLTILCWCVDSSVWKTVLQGKNTQYACWSSFV